VADSKNQPLGPANNFNWPKRRSGLNKIPGTFRVQWLRTCRKLDELGVSTTTQNRYAKVKKTTQFQNK